MKNWYKTTKLSLACVLSCVFLVIILTKIGVDFDTREQVRIANTIQPIERSVVKVKNAIGHGSGFIVDSSGIIVTAAHVMQHNPDTVVLSDGTTYPIKTERYINSELDVAIIKIDATKALPTIQLVSSAQYKIGESVIICGYPLAEAYRQSYGYIAGRRNKHEVQLDVDGNPGNSGGPILVDRNCIGMVTRGEYNSDISRGTCSKVIQACVDIYRVLYGNSL